jgi:hypothetical protein
MGHCCDLSAFFPEVIREARENPVHDHNAAGLGIGPIEGGHYMKYFRLDHPPERLILCNRLNCEGIADYLEVNVQGSEDFVCAARTSSKGIFQFFQRGYPSVEPNRSRPAA